MTAFQWISLVCILGVAAAGGYLPLFRYEKARKAGGFPLGEAFASGVFIALSQLLMLPAANHILYHKVYPNAKFPIAGFVCVVAFFLMLVLDHIAMHVAHKAQTGEDAEAPSPAAIPIIMTIMIAIPSFFLGTALGVSADTAALIIAVAIMAHKGSAGFALALKMVRSALPRKWAFVIYIAFACATPLGILVGADVKEILAGPGVLAFKGFVLAGAAGVFLYMSVLHELRHTPLIVSCCTVKGFICMLSGFGLTALIRLLLGEAHHM